ncbi:MAG: glucose-6-phosphate 1-dehydrogenase [Myxococcota bacterium]|jgi:glucose-6-phosphate 1-dehydrogenase
MSSPNSEPSLFIIFGGTGDLSRRKLLPALCRLRASGGFPASSRILGVARGSLTDAEFRRFAFEALEEAKLPADDIAAFCDPHTLFYETIDGAVTEDYERLRARIEALESDGELPGNRAFYLALPPRIFKSTIDALGNVGLNKSPGWTRVVVEKPFGHDLASALTLNEEVHEVFDESQVYRIDHYLGKETVQNLMVLRFANTIFESLWNRDRIESVQITVAEDLGVGTRGGYYDSSGALRDMIQNHLTQLLTLVAMEVPAANEADAIRYEKIKVLRSLRPLDPNDVVFGQYGPGEIDGKPVKGYLEENDIPLTSGTETFVAMRLFVDNWRWQGVPFYLRTGKRQEKRLSTITVQFRHTPVALFDEMTSNSALETADVLVITLQPCEGFSLHFDVKTPGSPFSTRRIPLRFRYDELFDDMPEAYQTLLLDVLTGDQTLFVHAEEVERSWAFYAPLQAAPPRPHPYPAGSWGPHAAQHLMLTEHTLWQDR